ncbi:OmpH family outer membrane protein [Chitinophaga sp. MM2321]|uniref:OmpH family outer membrane protein n=1 Tax=Chitinophaga sp. MM2321 TaxID=3137178 RepID=UPI0032D59296
MKFICTIMLLLIGSSSLFAQTKTAYINFQQLIGQMPEAKLANDTIQHYEQELNKDGQLLVAEYTEKLQAFDSLQATMSPEMKAVKAKDIQNAQANIQLYRERVEQKLNAREQQLLVPIMEKAKKAIKAAANEKGYTLVIDNSRDAVLIGEEADDLMKAVKVKLGIK